MNLKIKMKKMKKKLNKNWSGWLRLEVEWNKRHSERHLPVVQFLYLVGGNLYLYSLNEMNK